MEEKGVVTDVTEDTMTVEFKRSSMCEKCGACERAQEQMRIELRRQRGENVGDEVQVQLPEGTLLRAALLAYGLPLLLLLAGLFLGKQLPVWLDLPGNSDWYAMGLGLLFAAGSYALIRWTEPKRKKRGSYAPQVVQVERLCMKEREGKQDGK